MMSNDSARQFAFRVTTHSATRSTIVRTHHRWGGQGSGRTRPNSQIAPKWSRRSGPFKGRGRVQTGQTVPATSRHAPRQPTLITIRFCAVGLPWVLQAGGKRLSARIGAHR